MTGSVPIYSEEICKFVRRNFRYKNIRHGVPQGSVLGPILFLIYINDLARAIIYSKLYNFADDTAILYSDHNPKRLKKRINIDLKLLVQWLKANRIQLNVAKTEVVLFKMVQKGWIIISKSNLTASS